MSIHTWFSWRSTTNTNTSSSNSNSSPYSWIKGADWFLLDLNGSESHEILDERIEDEVLRRQTVKRGTDWIGQHYLETDTGSATVMKKTTTGIWFRIGDREHVHFYSDASWAEVERFLRG